MEQIIKWLQGYLLICIKGDNFELFLRACKAHRIYIWDIIHNDNANTLKLRICDFKSFAQLIKKTNLKMKVLQKVGLPMVIKAIMTKIFLVVIIVIALVILKYTEQYIWAMEIKGNYTISKEQIDDYLKTLEITYGMKMKNLDCEQTEMQLREHFPEITWVTVYVKGTKLHIELKENKSYEIVQQKEKKDILSPYYGIVTAIMVKQGTAMVKIGDEIEPDDILVDHRVPVYDENLEIKEYQETTPEATIRVQTTIPYHDTLHNTYVVTQFSNKDKKRNFVQFGRNRIFFDVTAKSRENVEKVCLTKQISLFEQIYLPLFYGYERERKVDFQYYVYSDQQMKKILSDNLEEYILCLVEKGVQIMKKNVKISKNGSTMYLSAEIEAIESIE